MILPADPCLPSVSPEDRLERLTGNGDPMDWPSQRCVCGAVNRLGARYCRACRTVLTGARLLNHAQVRPGPVSILAVNGRFRQPPSAADGWLYAHTLGGAVLQVAPQTAETREAGRFKMNGAGYNRAVLIDGNSPDKGFPRGATYLVATPEGVEALHLATGQSFRLFQARAGELVAANSGESDCQNMRGVAAHATRAIFVLRQGAETQTLMSLPIGIDRPPEALLVLAGKEVAGPLLCGSQAVYCTERQVGLARRRTEATVADFPRWFTPMLRPENGDLNLTPGGLPLVLQEAEDGPRVVLVAGWRNGREGLLQMDLDDPESARFRDLSRGSVLSTQTDGSACLCSDGAIEVLGKGAKRRMSASLKESMPASVAGSMLVWFEDHPYAEKHHVVLAWDEHRFSVQFESYACTPESCCGTFVTGEEFVTPYLDLQSGAGDAELKLVHCNLTGRA